MPRQRGPPSQRAASVKGLRFAPIYAHWRCDAQSRVTRPSLQFLDDLRQMPLNNVVTALAVAAPDLMPGKPAADVVVFRTQGPMPRSK
jgi:hypothetical protein